MGQYRGISELLSAGSTPAANYPQQLDEGGLFKWNIGLMVINSESAFDGGYFKVGSSFLSYARERGLTARC